MFGFFFSYPCVIECFHLLSSTDFSSFSFVLIIYLIQKLIFTRYVLYPILLIILSLNSGSNLLWKLVFYLCSGPQSKTMLMNGLLKELVELGFNPRLRWLSCALLMIDSAVLFPPNQHCGKQSVSWSCLECCMIQLQDLWRSFGVGLTNLHFWHISRWLFVLLALKF